MKIKAKKNLYLFLICVFLLFSIFILEKTSKTVKAENYSIKLTAYENMEKYMDIIKQEKLKLGIPLAKEDIHLTGMIGTSYSEITTSLGSIEAKRTSANADMAAMVVEMLTKAGVKSGDTIGANFSGSFPSLNLAVLAACDAMQVKCRYIVSIGSSNFGANNVELTFPDMANLLYEKGAITNNFSAFSIGGTEDLGAEMDSQTVANIVKRLKAKEKKMIEQSDYSDNINERREILEQDGPIKCFVSTGGNIASMGTGESSFYFGQGLLVARPLAIDDKSGLIEIYRNEGINVIHLLNLKKLTADYSLSYDPSTLPIKGTSAIFYSKSYNKLFSLLTIIMALASLSFYKKIK